MSDHAQIRARLQAQRNDILARLQRPADAPLDADAGERAIELENLDVLFELDQASRQQLSLINAALERIEQGRYSRCERCGGTIDAGRLRALPFAATCIDCAAAVAGEVPPLP